MELVTGRPQDKRIDKEERVYDLLDQLNIDYQRLDHQEANTMEVCLEIEKNLKSTICKNLFLVNSNKSQYYLLMLKGHKKFKTKVISKQINSSRLSFGSDEKMLEYLDITPGSVSVLGLMNDHEHHVQLLMDKDLLEDDYLGCHPCINTRSLKIKMKESTVSPTVLFFMPFSHFLPSSSQQSHADPPIRADPDLPSRPHYQPRRRPLFTQFIRQPRKLL